jgi:DNA polymerase (family 10)
MPIHNADIAAIFDEIADLLEIEEANPFRIRAYRNASRTLQTLGEEMMVVSISCVMRKRPDGGN